MKKILLRLSVVLVITLLTACGGGGGGGGGTSSTPEIVDGNNVPVANAGTAQNISTGATVTLDGSASSDADGDTLTYSWSVVSVAVGSSANLSSTDVVNPSFVADVDGEYVFELVVNDGTIDSDADTVTITASTGNSAPVANAGVDQNVATGATVTLNGSASSDTDGDALTYDWFFVEAPVGSSAALSSTSVVNPTFTADVDGTYELSLVVNDGTVDSTEDTVIITAATANSAPVANAGTNQNVATGSTVTLNGSASSDADGDLLTYSWSFTSVPTGSSATLSSTTAASPTFTADVDGSYVVSLTVNDGTVNSTADTVTVVAETANSTPVANAGIDQTIMTGSQVALDGSGSSDADIDALTYLWSFVSVPPGSTAELSDDTNIQPSFTADLDGSYVLQLIVNDGTEDSVGNTVTINATSNYEDFFSQSSGSGGMSINGYWQPGSTFSLTITNISQYSFVGYEVVLLDRFNNIIGFSTDSSLLGGEEVTPGEAIGVTFTLNVAKQEPITISFHLRTIGGLEEFSVSKTFETPTFSL